MPRDRDGSFEPKLIGKHERKFGGFDDKILAMYALHAAIANGTSILIADDLELDEAPLLSTELERALGHARAV